MLPIEDSELEFDRFAPFVGETGSSRGRGENVGVPEAVGVEALWSFEGVVGWYVGVEGRIVEEGEEGDSGRRKGEARGELKERVERL